MSRYIFASILMVLSCGTTSQKTVPGHFRFNNIVYDLPTTLEHIPNYDSLNNYIHHRNLRDPFLKELLVNKIAHLIGDKGELLINLDSERRLTIVMLQTRGRYIDINGKTLDAFSEEMPNFLSQTLGTDTSKIVFLESEIIENGTLEYLKINLEIDDEYLLQSYLLSNSRRSSSILVFHYGTEDVLDFEPYIANTRLY